MVIQTLEQIEEYIQSLDNEIVESSLGFTKGRILLEIKTDKRLTENEAHEFEHKICLSVRAILDLEYEDSEGFYDPFY